MQSTEQRTTHFLRDILRQPKELKQTLDDLSGTGRRALDAAVVAVHSTRHVYLTGIGSSWHAGLNVAALFHGRGRPVYLVDAAEMVQFAAIPTESVLIVISRSGRSVEIVQLLGKARESGATVIGITNVAEGTLAREAQIAMVVPVVLDHAISVNTYTTLALAAGVLAGSVTGSVDLTVRAAKIGCATADSLSRAFAAAGRAIPGWQAQIEKSEWLAPRSTTYFLARGSSLGSAYETRLMWEEGVKSPATAMGTGSFRHGPQEIVAKDAGELVFQLPEIASEWQFLIDIIPAQLVAERLARLSGSDPDTFRLSSFVVEDEGGLLPNEK